jgi:hypothetical protein
MTKIPVYNYDLTRYSYQREQGLTAALINCIVNHDKTKSRPKAARV